MWKPLCWLAAVLAVSRAQQDEDKCSWQSCAAWQTDGLNVHLIPHTHDDAGWLYTVDQYYWGDTGQYGVQYILNTIVKELAADPSKRFSYCESAFFWRWWNQQHDAVRHQVAALVRSGQLEFVNGGWVSNDEAAAHYVMQIEQMTLGLTRLNQTFGRCGVPRVAWQVDPFGHSKEQASLYAQMGMSATYFSRLHFVDFASRLAEQRAEMVWRASPDLGDDANIMTGHFNLNTYYPPNGFCFDVFCGGTPIMDDPDMGGYNLDSVLKNFVTYVEGARQHFRTNHLMVLMGGDFQWDNANQWYANLDKLIYHVNKLQSSNGSRINMFYSTPSCYTRAVSEAKVPLPDKEDDFFPYADTYHDYWTGYFTSRPTFKGMIRQASAEMQLCRSWAALANVGPEDEGDITVTEEALSLVQHHDAVTGTAKQVVTDDYVKRLYNGMQQCRQVLSDAMSRLTPDGRQQFCPLANVTVCAATKGNTSFVVTVYNGDAHNATRYVRLPFSYDAATVVEMDSQGNFLQTNAQLHPTYRSSQLSYLGDEQQPYELWLEARLPALGYKAYLVNANPAATISNRTIKKKVTRPNQVRVTARNPKNFTMENNMTKVTFNEGGRLTGLENKQTHMQVQLDHHFCYYQAHNDSNGPPSGAYIFRPDPHLNGGQAVCLGDPDAVEMIDGDVVQEVRQHFNSYMTQIVRLYRAAPQVELEWTVGPLPYNKSYSDPGIGHEPITRFNTDISSGSTFYTDSNGRQIVTRKLNYQPTYEYEDSEPVAGNYYPVNSLAFVKDASRQLTVLTDRSQGAASLVNGSLELMVHRRLFYDDWKGVDEALNETGVSGTGLVARGRHWLLLDAPEQAARRYRPLAQSMYHQPMFGVAPIAHAQSTHDTRVTQWSGLRQPLPDGVNLLSLAQWQTGVLVRLEHIYQANELADSYSVDLTHLFSTFTVVSCEPLSLAANQAAADVQKWPFTIANATAHSSSSSAVQPALALDGLTVTLKPMQIVTLRCQVQYH